MGALGNTARITHVLCLAAWFGAVALVFAIRPEVVGLVGSSQDAAALLGGALALLSRFSWVAVPVVLLSLLLGWASLGIPLRGRVLSALGFSAVSLLGGQWLWPRLERARLALGRPLEDLGADDGLARAYLALETYSLVTLAITGILAIFLIIWAVRGAEPRKRGGIQL